MRSSSKTKSSAQLELDLGSEPMALDQEDASQSRSNDKGVVGGNVGALGLPAFAYAESARMAGRLNASVATDEELAELLRERAALLDKYFAKTITPKESNRLQYVRWSLDRIEDARFGHRLDTLDAVVSQYERFFEDVRSLGAQLSRLEKGK